MHRREVRFEGEPVLPRSLPLPGVPDHAVLLRPPHVKFSPTQKEDRNDIRVGVLAAIRKRYRGYPEVGQVLGNYELAPGTRKSPASHSLLYDIEVPAARYRLLEGPEEISLAMAIERGFQTYARIGSIEATDPDDIRTFLGGTAAADVLFCANQRMALDIVRKRYGETFKNRTFLQDIAKESLANLDRLVPLFDYRKNLRFSTFAYSAIGQRLTEFIQMNARLVTLPRTVDKQYRNMIGGVPQLTARLQREPTLPEIAEHLSLSIEEVEELQCHGSYFTASLDQPVGESETITLGDTIPHPSEDEEGQNSAERLEAEETLHRTLAGDLLSLDEKAAVSLRHGIHCDLPEDFVLQSSEYEALLAEARSKGELPFERIGEALGIPRTRAWGFNSQALQKFAESEELREVA